MRKNVPAENALIIGKIIEKRIFFIRGVKVMLDSDLAVLYGVETRILNRNVQRNLSRFPKDFMFQLEFEEWESLKSQFGISKQKRGGRRFLPFAFTEGGVAMLSSVLSSEIAIQTNVIIIRTFIKMRNLMTEGGTLFKRLEDLEKSVTSHDIKIAEIFKAIRELLMPNRDKQRSHIGIRPKD